MEKECWSMVICLKVCQARLVTLSSFVCWPLSGVFHQQSSVRGWTSAFLLTAHRLCAVIEGRLSHFLPRWLRTGWQSVISQGKIPWNTPLWLGSEPGPRGGQTVSYSTERSCLTCQVKRIIMQKLVDRVFLLSVSQDASLEDFLLGLAYPID